MSNIHSFFRLFIFALACVGAAILPGSQPLSAQSALSADEELAPEIVAIRMDSDQLIVTVRVPSGLRKIVLEGRSRLAKGNWIPRAVRHLDGAQSTKVEFSIKADRETEMLRVRAMAHNPLPSSFYEGRKEFEGSVSDSVNAGGPEVAVDSDRVEDMAPPAEEGDANREVVESDIWAFRGETLYFFNSLEGLQVIDLSDPKAPVVSKRFFLPAAGEQMYVIDDNHIALMVNDYCGYYEETTGSQVLIIDVSQESLTVTGSIRIPGQLQESRLVGTVLYTSSSEYRPVMEGGSITSWESGSALVAIQLADPANPIKTGERFFAGWAEAVSATDRYFLIATHGIWPYNNTELHVVDISNLNGSIGNTLTIPVKGWIRDKFKMSVSGSVLTVIAEVRNNNGQLSHTSLENYSLENSARAERLGSVTLGKNEALFATRFDGQRVYIVTFERIDPLWIVDNSDPRDPKILGELEIPGWSTYIHPMGDRLITMGIDNIDGWRPAVQMFDVSDPAQPTLLSKVLLGDSWGWSEANQDEKAFRVLTDEGMILVPFSAWSDRSHQSGMQIVDFDESKLTLRGVIEHDFVPRRATTYGEYIYSISNQELVTVDASNRDKPNVLSEIQLTRSADKVLEWGDYILTAQVWWNGSGRTRLSVYAKSDLETPVDDLEFSVPEDLAGSPKGYSFSSWFLAQGKLHLVLSTETVALPPIAEPASGSKEEADSEYVSYISIFSIGLSDGVMAIENESHQAFHDLGWNLNLEAKVFSDSEVVLTRQAGYGYYFLDDVFWGGPFRPWGWNMPPLFISLAIPSDGAAQFLNTFSSSQPIDPELGGWIDYSGIFWNGRQAFYSTQISRMVLISPDTTKPPLPVPPGEKPVDPEFRQVWLTENQLTKVDFTDLTEPTQHDPINIPGKLVGLTHQGNVLLTSGNPYTDSGDPKQDQLAIHASAYDEVEVRLIDTLVVSNLPYEAEIVADTLVYANWTEKNGYAIQGVRLDEDGKLGIVSTFGLPGWSRQLRAEGSLLMSAHYSKDGVLAIDYSNPSAPVLRSKWSIPGCLYPDISNMAGTVETGFYIPLGVYGLGIFDVNAEE